MKNRIDERALTRKFLNSINESMIGLTPINMPSSSCKEDEMHGMHDEEHGQGHGALKTDQYGVVPKDELYSHFDLDNDGTVTPEEYAEHIEFHCAHPESLEHYNKAREQSIHTVPCKDSYDSCSQHLMGCPDDIDKFLKPMMDCTGSTCRESSTKALLDVLQSLINCGVFG